MEGYNFESTLCIILHYSHFFLCRKGLYPWAMSLECIGRIRSLFIYIIFVLAYPVQFMHGEREHWNGLSS